VNNSDSKADNSKVRSVTPNLYFCQHAKFKETISNGFNFVYMKRLHDLLFNNSHMETDFGCCTFPKKRAIKVMTKHLDHYLLQLQQLY
jgi:hypothetical protein